MSRQFTSELWYDVIIVGARCAGAATALLLARRGLKVLAVEKRNYESDTLSTHALMRGGVLQLARWGVLDDIVAAGTPAVRTTSFHYGDEIVEVPIKPSDGVEALYAPRRMLLDRILVDAARNSGAEIRFETAVVDLLRSDSGRVCGAILRDASGGLSTIRSDIVIGADGIRSMVAREVEAPTYRLSKHASAVLYGYWAGIPADGYHWHFRAGVSTGTIPTNNGETCIFVSVAADRFRDEVSRDVSGAYRRLLMEASPGLTAWLAAAHLVERLRGFGGENGFMRQSFGPGWALVGDAGYFKDPLTAHGITDALRDAELLAEAVACGSDHALAAYQQQRDELSMPLFEVTDAIASFVWSLERLKDLHFALNAAMKAECGVLSKRGAMGLPQAA
jgi:2-polyprenyl-6-methoxyphenol hydroxylase-like FAD-dependent oxidoreductase